MSYSIEQLRALLVIDKHNLDEELIRQPQLYDEAARGAARAASIAAKKKLERNETEAKRATSMRNAATKKGQKITEAQVNKDLPKDPEFIKASLAYIAAEEDAGMWAALKDAFAQRSYALKDLVQLYLGGFFQADRVGAATPRSREQVDYDQHRAAMAEDRKRRAKTKNKKTKRKVAQ